MFLFKLFYALVSGKKDDSEPTSSTSPNLTLGCYSNKVIVSEVSNTPTVLRAIKVSELSVNPISINNALTIEDDEVIRFKDNVFDKAMLVSTNGKIYAVNNPANPVVFTTYKDDARRGDANGIGNTSSFAEEDGYAIHDISSTMPVNIVYYNLPNFFHATYPVTSYV